MSPLQRAAERRVIERSIPTTTHGRYLVDAPELRGAAMLVGFHGYAEGAEIQLERLRSIPGAGRWLVVSIQALNRFYQRRTDEVIAGWMTRQDRDAAIVDNLTYVSAVVSAVASEFACAPAVLFAGFSQGVAMAYRAAVASTMPVRGVIAAGGDVPPELDRAALARVGAALVCRGARDGWYSPETFRTDLARLREAGLGVTAIEFDGGHEWSSPVAAAAAQFLSGRHP
jgi:predicted esterase